MSVDYSKYNTAVQETSMRILAAMKSMGKSMGITHRGNSPSTGDSLAKIKDRYGNDSFGVINRVSFTNINRSLIYTTVGAGKGRGGRKGSRWVNRKGEAKRTAPSSLGKMGTGGRAAKPFIDQTLDSPDGIEALADTVAEYQADAVIDSVYLK